MLCERCRNIHFKRIQDCEVIPEPYRAKDGCSIEVLQSVFYFLHENKQALQKSAEEGCHFCGMLWGGLFDIPQMNNRRPLFSTCWVVLTRPITELWIGKGLEGWNRLDHIYVECERRGLTIIPDMKPQGRREIQSRSAIFTSLGLPGAMVEALTTCRKIDSQSTRPLDETILMDNDELHIISKEPERKEDHQIYAPWVDTTTLSQASLTLASVWLESCLRNHRACKEAQKEAVLPYRVIDINNPLHPRLVNGEGRIRQYATLSYKWGSSHKYVTDSENIAEHRKEISPNYLPATFKDAIHVAYTLGLRWLWIDALCIIQDSKEDQVTEMNKMDQIFQSSTLTLYAVAAENVEAGLSMVRDPRTVKPCRLDLKTTLDGKFVEARGYFRLDWRDEPVTPLFTRGWVLQEQVLATRGLLFGVRDLAWRCHCCPLTGRNCPSIGIDCFDGIRDWLWEKDPFRDLPLWRRINQFDYWYMLIREFSKRSLTSSCAILPAVAGLANAMAKTHGCTYLTGLWEEDIQTGLCWCVVGATDCKGDDPDLPSWTWVAQWGKILDFSEWKNNSTHDLHLGVQLTQDAFKDHESGSNSFKNAQKKVLVLTGRLRTAKFGCDPNHMISNPIKKRGLWMATILDSHIGRFVGEIALDDPKYMSVSLIYCLLCRVRRKDWDRQITCLGLIPTDSYCRVFKRIGLVFIYEVNWFGELKIVPTLKDARLARTICLV